MTYVEEAIGIVRAATAAGMPVVISFTVETDGRLPSGQSLADAIEQVDRETDGAAAYFMVNCAHPTHFARTCSTNPGRGIAFVGIRANASTMSHAELDEAEELDDGDPEDLARGYVAIGDAAAASRRPRWLLRHRPPTRREHRGRLVRPGLGACSRATSRRGALRDRVRHP